MKSDHVALNLISKHNLIRKFKFYKLYPGRTDVVVIYCQHEDSRELDTLYDRGLGNNNKHATLRQLQRQNRFLSIDQEFSPYQTDYMKIFLHETLYQ